MKRIQALVASVLLGASLACAAGTVDINRADADTLARELNGVGPSKAQAIIRYRDANGPFGTIDALSEVRGISDRIVDINRERILIGDDPD